jgi:hypothetical protein
MEPDRSKTPFIQAVKEFEAVQEEYSEFGAWDTEPRTEFALYIAGIVESATWGPGAERPLPRTINDWSLFDRELLGKPGAGKAARALTKAARKAGQEARRDIATASWYVRYS